jgi:hypothetical protein
METTKTIENVHIEFLFDRNEFAFHIPSDMNGEEYRNWRKRNVDSIKEFRYECRQLQN